jgi:5-methylcytosine-specific restriction protein A
MSRHTQMYANTRWRKRRAEQLRKSPLCAYCLRMGKATSANTADHITPHKGDPVKFEGPLQSLCHDCHVKVKALEERGKGQIGGDAQGNPIDPHHHWNVP